MVLPVFDLTEIKNESFLRGLLAITEWEEARRDPLRWLAYVEGKLGRVTIYDQNKGLVAFRPYPHQAGWAADTRPALGVVKARQIGMTHAEALAGAWQASTRPGFRWVIVSRMQEHAAAILAIANRFLAQARKAGLCPPDLQMGRTATRIPSVGAEILAEACSKGAAQGWAVSRLTLDEFALMQWQDEAWEGATASAQAPGSMVRVISTPKGTGNRFYGVCMEMAAAGNLFAWDGAARATALTWRARPDFTEEWAERRVEEIGRQAFEQEHEGKFVAAGEAPLIQEMLDRCWPKEIMRPSIEKVVTGCDPAGMGEDLSAWVTASWDGETCRFFDRGSLRAGPVTVLQAELAEHVARHASVLYIDETGLGWGIVGNLPIALGGVVGITITGGSEAKRKGFRWRVPKTDLLRSYFLAIEQVKVEFPAGWDEVVRQHLDYQWDDAGLRTDWVMACALAWQGMRGRDVPVEARAIGRAGGRALSAGIADAA